MTHINEKGSQSAEYDFARLPVSPELQLEFATVFASRAKPTGRWRNLPTSKQGYWAIHYFARWLAKQDRVPRSVADIDAALWLRWRMEHMNGVARRRAMRIVRMLLLDTGSLSADTRREVAKRVAKDEPNESSYSDDELRLIVIAARRVWRTARDRIRGNVDHLVRYRAGEFQPGTSDYVKGTALELIASTGDVPRTTWNDRAPEPWVALVLGGGHRNQTWKRLYLDDAEAMSALVLLACKEGWNKTSIEELTVPERIDGGSSQPVYRVELEKRRRRPPHRYETRTLTDDAPDSTARLLGHIIEVTQPARDVLALHGHPTNRLLVSHRSVGLGRPVEAMFQHGLGSHARDGFRKASGQAVNLRRVRKAVNNRHRRGPNQNTRETHEGTYLLRDAHTIEDSEALIARGIERALTHAETIVATVKAENSEAGTETPTAACMDLRTSPYSPWGVPCTASFLLCLACHNAVVMPKHLGRLAFLHQCLHNRRLSLPPETWTTEWAAHYARLDSLRTEHYTEGQWQQALDSIRDEDRTLVDYLLKGDLDA